MNEPTSRAASLSAELEGATPASIIGRALEVHGPDVAIAFSGSDDVLLIEYAKQQDRPFRVFSIDTGRLHPETYELMGRVEEHYDIRIEVLFPQTVAVEQLVRDKGLFSFYRDGHTECCSIRKVEPLRRHLTTVTGWITGQRRDQSPRTRGDIPLVEVDAAHLGADGRPVLKWNPLAHRSQAEVWDAIRAFDVPINALHGRGYVSIGCAPCTRPVLPGQHEREGRWWWEGEDHKECGLHEINLDPTKG